MKKSGGERPTWRESDIGDDVLAVVEGHQVLQGVCVHNEEAAVIQPHRQSFAIRGEAAATAACVEENVLVKAPGRVHLR